jgi:hypothetical protein
MELSLVEQRYQAVLAVIGTGFSDGRVHIGLMLMVAGSRTYTRRDGIRATTISAMNEKKKASTPHMNGERPFRLAMAEVQAMMRIHAMNPMTAPIKVADEFDSASRFTATP